ncbi:cytochrome C [Panacibacter ginsenosidivorans]|uniref:Cytochrome C n=1 Tax=Panacibacter ginsenosidivorans TaxID=1813871 RepID=A0A5B8VBT5_9BACT|nr:heme-binding domain-containing protein [Panacibacter ginsenosidivorans]QEC68146.1 cytochrome C [Panacibacter ginsenosidivorans]
MKKKIFIVLVVLIVVIQFFKPAKNLSTSKSPNDISSVYNVPENIGVILDKACNDCHTNNTVYPWYAEIQPVAWWLNNHIEEGKEELNFSEFASYSPARQYRKLEEVKKQIDEGEMPISSYTLIHTNAKLTDAEKQTLLSWTEGIRTEMKAKYPADSLVIKKGPRPPEE